MRCDGTPASSGHDKLQHTGEDGGAVQVRITIDDARSDP